MASVFICGLLLLSPRSPLPPGRVLAQEPTLVITQPTPTATPAPFAAQGALTQSALGQGAGAYIVQPGDTLLSAALEMGLDVEAMGCVLRPDFDPAQPLVIGDALPPLPAGTICRRTLPGDTLRTLAEAQGIAPESIAADPWNGLAGVSIDAPLPAGRRLRIPLGQSHAFDPVVMVGASGAASPFLTWMLAQQPNTLPQEALGTGGPLTRLAPLAAGPVPADWPYGTGKFAWPAYGLLTQSYRYDHRALDIAAPAGSPVTAADRGVVIRAGWNHQGYGQFVIVDHKIDYLTLYAHLDTIFVAEGEVVAQGQLLGTVGATGNATGPHLHFEIRDFGRLTNPLELLAQ